MNRSSFDPVNFIGQALLNFLLQDSMLLKDFLPIPKSALMLFVYALLTACSPQNEAQPEPSAELKWQQASQRGLYTVSIEPRNGRIPIGEFHEWIISLQDADGNPVAASQIAMFGGMPSHGHGLPTQPEVTDYLGQGRHLIEGVRFSMAGAWVLKFRVMSAVGPDQVQFDIELGF